MCKELCGVIYDDFKAGRISYKHFKEYHNEQVLKAMSEDAAKGGTILVHLDYRDGDSDTLVLKPAPKDEQATD